MNAGGGNWGRACVPALAFALALAGAWVHSSPAVAAPKPCPAGKGASFVGKKRTCVLLAQLLPMRSALDARTAGLARRLLENPADDVLRRAPFVPARAHYRPLDRRIEPVTDRRGVALAGRLDQLVRGGGANTRGLAAVITTEPAPTVTSGPRSAEGHARTKQTDTVGGVTGTLDLDVHLDRDAGGTPTSETADLTLGGELVRAGQPGRLTFEIAARLQARLKLKDPCPTAAGAVQSDGSDSFRWRQGEEQTAFGIDYMRKLMTGRGTSRFIGTVGPDAALTKVDYRVELRQQVVYSASFLHGLIRQDWTLTISVDATGKLDGATGRVTSGETHVTYAVVDRRGGGEASALAQLEGDRDLRRKFEQQAADAVEGGYKQIKGAEQGWQKPNACASIAYDPATAPVAPGGTKRVSAKVTAKNGGGVPEGRWQAVAVGPGRVGAGLPGSSAAGTPLGFDVVGDAPNAAGNTAVVRLQAKSRAGVAEATWLGLVPAYDVVFNGRATSGQTPTFALTADAAAQLTTTQKTDVTTAYWVEGTGPLAFSGVSDTRYQPGLCPTYTYGQPSGTLRVFGTFEAGAAGAVLALTVLPGDSVSIVETDCFDVPFALQSSIFLGFLGALPVLRVPAAGGAATHSWDYTATGSSDKGAFTITATPKLT